MGFWLLVKGVGMGGITAGVTADFVCMKNVTGTLVTSALTVSEMKAALTGSTITADLTTRCQ